jgi:hypothetical protein
MEKPKNTKRFVKLIDLWIVVASMFVIGICGCLSYPFAFVYFVDNVTPWTFIPLAPYPDAVMISTSGVVSYGSGSRQWTYCTNATVEELMEFYTPQIEEFLPNRFNADYFAHFREQARNYFLPDTFWDSPPNVTLWLWRNQPNCTTGAIYGILIDFDVR